MATQSWPERPFPAHALVVPSYGYSPKIIEERPPAEALEETIPRTSLILEATLPLAGHSAAERETSALLRQKDVLLREMQHRVANSLQIIASMLLLKAREARSEETRQHLKDAHRRIMSVAIVQQQLDASRHGGQIEIGPYLSRLCDSLTASLVDDDHPVSIKVQADRGRIASAAAVSIGLIVAELVINALKHAFADDTAAGLIVVAYEAEDASWRLGVSDNGIGTSSGPGRATAGLGMGIVEALAQQLDGRVETSMGPNAGTLVTITHGLLGLRLRDH